MPYKVYKSGGRFCVHKINADGSKGRSMGCHDSPEKARAQQKALYANTKETDMSKMKRIKERQRRERRQQLEFQKQDDLEILDDEDEELTEEEELALLEQVAGELEAEEGDPNEVKKSYDDYAVASEMTMQYGPTSFEELDDARAAEKKAGMIRRASWDVESLVHNIIASPMYQGSEKADMIKKVGNDFGERVRGIMDTPAEMLKERAEVLEVEAVLAHDERNQSLLEKTIGLFQKRELSGEARKSLADSDFALPDKRKYPIHDKAHVRNALARAAQQLKKGGEGAEDARKALPKIRAAAKKMGIETSMEKEHTGIIVQKDANGDWRWIGWPSNNFIDRSQDILTKEAHEEYVEWWHKNKGKLGLPVFTSLHAPGTARTHPVDFVGFENGFLVMSGKLTEDEAVRLLEVQKEYDLGMSHTGWGIRSAADPRQIVMYRIFEVTDLPIEMADNPFTDLSVISKEADMKTEEQLAYLTKLLGSKEKAEEALSSKTSIKQKELQEAQVEQKETMEQPAEQTAPQTPDLAAIIKAVGEEFDIDGLNQFVQNAQEAVEKVGLLESVIEKQQETIQKLSGQKEEQLAEMLTPPAQRFAWSQKARASQSKKTVVSGEQLQELKSKQAGIPADDEYWLSQATGTAPVTAEAEA